METPFPTPLLRSADTLLGPPGGTLTRSSLAGDGSDRRFFRFRKGSRRVVGIWSPRRTFEGVDENDSYFHIGQHLFRRGLPVPQILWSDLSQGLFLVEDVGDLHLQGLALRCRNSLSSIYGHGVKLLVRLHERAAEGFEPGYCFDAPVYDPPFVLERELEYFRKSFLIDLLGFNVSTDDDLRRDFERLSGIAGVSDHNHVMHRDFQSRNLMVHKGRIRLLDFQGMRYGPPAYDLASLLIDPYVGLPERLQADLADLYWRRARRFLRCSRQDFRESYTAVRLCRNLQALAAYAFLGLGKGKGGFLAYVLPAWKCLQTSVLMAGAARYPSLHRLVTSEHSRATLRRRMGKLLRDIRG